MNMTTPLGDEIDRLRAEVAALTATVNQAADENNALRRIIDAKTMDKGVGDECPRMLAACKEGRGINEGCALELELYLTREQSTADHAEMLKALEMSRDLREAVDMLRSLLIEWMNPPIFKSEDDWAGWVVEFQLRTEGALRETEEPK